MPLTICSLGGNFNLRALGLLTTVRLVLSEVVMFFLPGGPKSYAANKFSELCVG